MEGDFLKPIALNEIPLSIRSYVQNLDSLNFPRQGYTSDVVFLGNHAQKFVLKRTKGEYNCALLKKEVKNLEELFNQKNFNTPKLHLFVENQPRDSWLLMQRIEGETVRSALTREKNKAKREEILFNFGKVLSQIHKTPCTPSIEPKPTWLKEMLIQAEYNFHHHKVDGNQKMLEKIISRPLNIERRTLIHGDFTIDNVLVQGGIISGVIDWGNAAFGDPRYDISLAIRPKPNVFQEDVDRTVFFEGYGEKLIDHHIYDYYVNGLYEFF